MLVKVLRLGFLVLAAIGSVACSGPQVRTLGNGGGLRPILN